MKRRTLITLALLASFTGLAHAEPDARKDELQDIRIKMETTKGTIEATMFASKAPMTVANFLNLAKRGYFDGIAFHRVIDGFMIQGGDPTETGRGGPGYQFDNEISPALNHNKAGIFSMANSGPDTNGSQFFITMGPAPFLNGGYSAFGEVTKGLDVVKSIVGKLDTGEPKVKFDGKGDKIKSIEILDSTDALFAAEKDKLDEWNKILDAKKKE
ncbi:peptidylprolyl isomerase [Haloferula sargassicola]|uniref:Peptidyl-prolyl cis-trans isomerase n=1 Tax=Haloferula sargassicola TaxID=490096 RepID=A0ABP9UW35_9BACT